MKKVVFLCTVLLTLLNCKTLDLKEINLDKAAYEQLPEGLYGNLKTTKGDILVKFNDKESPVTVANFVGLAEGKIENSAKKKGEPFYNGTIFHRVIKDFMIQEVTLKEQEWVILVINSMMKKMTLSIQEKVFFLWLILVLIPTDLSSLLLK